ncbi:MAG: hypothetical protein AAB472_03420 [Patescibacteria group bacterium]
MPEQRSLRVRAGLWIQANKGFCTALAFILAVMLVPTILPRIILGEDYKDVPVAFTDAAMYQAHVAHVGRGHLSDGNPYLLEHAHEPALVIFLGDYLHALPLFVGVPLVPTLFLNLLVFSLLFAISFYLLFLRLGVGRNKSALGVALLYLLFFSHIDRPSNMQPFLPLLALFYIGLLGMLEAPTKRSIALVATTLGAMFYFYSYLWQSFVISLGLLFLYALVRKQKERVKGTVLAGSSGVLIGLPSLFYILWLSHTSPYFWESIGRYGLVETHLPMMEALYSGGWVWFALCLLSILLWRVKVLRNDSFFTRLSVFFFVSGFGLWFMQVSNVLTGKLLENAQHMVYFIAAWLILFVFAMGARLYDFRHLLTRRLQALVFFSLLLLTLVSLNNLYRYYVLNYIRDPLTARLTDIWRTQQLSQAPLAYIDAHETDPVVIWEDPHDMSTWDTPVLSRDYVLFATPAMWHLVPDGELVERFLVAEYFATPTEESLKKDVDLYLGRQWAFHKAKTIERRIKLCRILHHLTNPSYDCGTVPSSVDVIGEERFVEWERKFTSDIKPHILDYLAKYHVSYILKDVLSHPEYQPEKLGAKKVYEDGRFELWKLANQ